MGRKKKRRSLEQRIADEEAKLAELKAKQKQQQLSKALDEGLVSDENKDEFKKLQKAVNTLTKAVKIADEYNREDLRNGLEELRSSIAEAMRSLIEDDDGDDDDDDDDDDEFEDDD